MIGACATSTSMVMAPSSVSKTTTTGACCARSAGDIVSISTASAKRRVVRITRVYVTRLVQYIDGMIGSKPLAVAAVLVTGVLSQTPARPAATPAPPPAVTMVPIPYFNGANAIWGATGQDARGHIWFGVTTGGLKPELRAPLRIHACNRRRRRSRQRRRRAAEGRSPARGREPGEDPLEDRPGPGAITSTSPRWTSMAKTRTARSCRRGADTSGG